MNQSRLEEEDSYYTDNQEYGEEEDGDGPVEPRHSLLDTDGDECDYEEGEDDDDDDGIDSDIEGALNDLRLEGVEAGDGDDEDDEGKEEEADDNDDGVEKES